MSSQQMLSIGASAAIRTPAVARHRAKGMHLAERRLLLVTGDMAAISMALLFVLWVGFPGLGTVPRTLSARFIWWPVLWGLWLPLATTSRCYDLRRVANTAMSVVYAALVAGLTSAIYLVIPVISAPLTRSRLAWLVFALSTMVALAIWRVIYGSLVSQEGFERRVLVVGAGASGQELVETVDALGDASGVKLLGFLDDHLAFSGTKLANRPVLGTFDRLAGLVDDLNVDEIVLAYDGDQLPETLMNALESMWGKGISVVPVQLYFEQIAGAVMVQRLGQNVFLLLNGRELGLNRLWDACKRFLDICVGVVGLAALAPLFPFIALAIRLDSRGPILYRQQRVGLNGECFWLTKFRSMVNGAERNGAVWATTDDPRITRVGRLLRKARIDELPQLWNLVNGTMTLIGPRPERPEFVRQLNAKWASYAIRHSVKPGLTGWAQVKYRYGNTLDDALMKLQYDLYYVKHRGPILDAIVLLHTVRVVLAMAGT